MRTMPPPSGAFVASTRPPWLSAAWRTIARPSPEPVVLRASLGAVEAIEDVGQILLREALAVIAHRHGAICERDLDRAARRAPLARVVEQVRDRAGDALGLAADDRRLERALEREVGEAALEAIDQGVDERVELDVVEALGRPRPPGKLDDVAHEARSARRAR